MDATPARHDGHTLFDARLPTLLTPGLLGAERSRRAWRLVRETLLESPLPPVLRTALLCAALERPDGLGSGIHATGLTLLGQGDELVDLRGAWRDLAREPAGRRLLNVTAALGRGGEVPADTLLRVCDDLGPLAGAWQDLVALAAWCDGLYRVHAPAVTAHPDPRVGAWLGRVVAAAGVLDDIR